MKVLFLSSCVYGGGAGQSLATYLKYKSKNIQAYVVLPEPGIIANEFAPYAQLVYIPEFVERIHLSPYKWARKIKSGKFHILLNMFSLFVAAIKITGLARKIKPDLIYCNHMLAKPIGVIVGEILNIPVILHVRNIHASKFGSMFYRFLARREIVKRLVCNSQASAAIFQSEVPEKIRIVYNSIDDEKFLTQTKDFQKKNHERITFGYLGRLVPKKGVKVLLEAFDELSKKYPDARLLIVGENDKGVHEDLHSQYQDFCIKHRIVDKVEFTGFQKDIRKVLSKMDVMVLPSVEPESFGRVLIEAMTFRIPSITTALGGSAEVIENQKNGIWCKPGNVESLVQAMEYFCKNPQKIMEMGEAGYERLQERYLSSSQSKKIDQAIEQTCL